MENGTRSGKSLSLGMPMAPQYNLRTPKSQSLGIPPKASPLSSTSIGNFTWSYIFIYHMIFFCLKRLVLFESLLVSFPQSSLLYTPFERDTHDSEFIRILYVLHLYILSYIVFALCASLISFELYSFCSSASLISFRARRWFYFIEIIVLSCFTYIILRVLNSMVIFLNWEINPNMLGIQD